MAIFKLLKGSPTVKHTHILYAKDDGTGVSTVNKGHSHNLEVQAQYSETQVTDPNTGMPVMQRQQTGVIPVITEANGHTHEISDVVIEDSSKKKESEDELLEMLYDHYKIAFNLNKESRDKANDSEKYFKNEQWRNPDKKQMEATNRPCLTYNIIYPRIKTLSGVQRQNRTDFKFYPIEGSDQRGADILDVVVKSVLTNTNYWGEETELFERVAMAGLEAFEVFVDYTNNIEGDIVIQDFSWRNFLLGKHVKKDCSDLEYLVKIKRINKKKLKEMYPEKRDEIDEMFKEFSDMRSGEYAGMYSEEDGHGANLKRLGSYNWDEFDKDTCLFKEFWLKEWERQYIFTDVETEEAINLAGWKESDVKSLKTLPNVDIVNRVTYKIRVVKLIGKLILEDEYPDLPVNDFNIIPVYAEKVNDEWFGKVELVKNAQDEINKRMSTMADQLNKMNFSGYFYDDETFGDNFNEDGYKRNISRPGFLQKVKDLTRIPIKVEGVQYPQALENATAAMLRMVDQLMNINPEMLGQPSSVESGKALLQKERQALLGNEYLYDNLSLAKKKLGRYIVAMIQKTYSVDRILRILNNQHMRDKSVEIGGIPYDQYTPEEITELINNTDLTKYDVAIEEVNFTPTMRLWISSMLAELAAKGVQVPPEIIIEMFPLPDVEKKKILDSIQQAKQAAAQEQQMKSQAEIQKTMIAKGMPPQQ